VHSKRISFPTIYLFLHFSISDFARDEISRRAINYRRVNRRLQPLGITSRTMTGRATAPKKDAQDIATVGRLQAPLRATAT